MGSIKKSNPNGIHEAVEVVLRQYVSEQNHLVLALSGGVDSVVLLQILAQISKQFTFNLSAIHIEHGISPNTKQWSDFCQNYCDALGIPLTIFSLSIKKQAQVSLEAAARQARYAIFKEISADCIVLAHHLDDQAETLQLQLLRGAGLRGLAGMPIMRLLSPAGKIKLLRPLLTVSRDTIQGYALQNKLMWITDESNDDTTYHRNFLRHQIFPLLEQRYPVYRETLARTSRHMGEAVQLLDSLAENDSQLVMVAGEIHIERLRKLDFLRAKNLLRYIFSRRDIIQPSTQKLEEILRQLWMAKSDNYLYLTFGEFEIRLYKNLVRLLPKAKSKLPGSDQDQLFYWHGEPNWVIEPLGGVIKWSNSVGIGINAKKLMENSVAVRLRKGGERFQLNCKRPRRSLKKIFQEAEIPEWERNNLPLLLSGDQLVWVAGIGIDCGFQAMPGEQGLVPSWHPH
ncbi:MAG: tRNA lysidine(34) synthetase TilS [Nitrosomonas sp.]|nr:tRNA lysidine(34) synthetase TilS [Nitrosomonas sp.]